MRKEMYMYDVCPKIFKVGQEVRIDIRAIVPSLALDEAGYDILVCGVNDECYGRTKKEIPLFSVFPKDDVLSFSHVFPREQEYLLRICLQNDSQELVVALPVYAVDADLFERRPFVGSFHTHTTNSDGCEDPAFFAAHLRENGYDFTVISDHYNYQSSLSVISRFKVLDTAYRIYQGEEVHSPGNKCDILNFGGDISVGDLCYERPDVKLHREPEKMGIRQSWMDEVEALASTYENLPENVDPFILASCVTIARKIREGGGLSILCHPHFRDNYLYVRNINDSLTRYLLTHKLVDSLEILNIGMLSLRQHMCATQVALCYDLAYEGVVFPVVGGNDAHTLLNHQHFLKLKTIVFARENSRDAIVDAVKNCYSVAVEELEPGLPCMYFSHRLISYALFVYDWLLPLLAPLCAREGKLMREYLAGDMQAIAESKQLKAQIISLREKYFA